ncbi:MAG: hypothetical protein NZ534_03290, partial [Bacteroidia bacterium]|nr:hypothetical protein [Bacteroidia bacterium]
MRTPRNPFDYLFKRFFARGAKRFYERIAGEPVASFKVVDEAELQIRVASGAADVLVEVITVSGRRLILHVEIQKTYDENLGVRMAKYCIAIKEEYGLYPMQIVLCIENFADRFANGAELGNAGQPANIYVRFQAFNLCELPAEWFVARDEMLSVGVGLFCDMGPDGEQTLLNAYRQALQTSPPSAEDVADFMLALQLSLKMKRINNEIYIKFMEATLRHYDVGQLIRELIDSHPQFRQAYEDCLNEGLKESFQKIFDDGRKA